MATITATAMITTTTAMIMTTDASLVRLMTWLSPSFPVGAFSFSHGIEAAAEAGLIADRAGLVDWIEGVLAFGAGRLDASIFRLAYEAAGGEGDLAEIVEAADIHRGTLELALEARVQGQAFLDAVLASWPLPRLAALAEEARGTGRPVAYPVALALAAAAHEVPMRPALAAFLHAFVANLVSAAVRIVPLGQTDGQRAIAGLQPAVAAAVEAALAPGPVLLGNAALMVDFCSMAHERQWTRLFRS
jgi:urease accessory protein